MFSSKINSNSATDTVAAGGNWDHAFIAASGIATAAAGAAKFVPAPARKHLTGSRDGQYAESVSAVPIKRGSLEPEGLHLPVDVWFYL